MKKAEELHFVELLIKGLTDEVIDTLRPFEGPDFLALHGGEPLGVEVTKYFHPDTNSVPGQAIEGYRQKLKFEMDAEHKRRGLAPAHISVFFRHAQALKTKTSRTQLRDKLLTLVADNMPATRSKRSLELEDIPSDLLDLGVISCTIYREIIKDRIWWSFPYAGFMPRPSAEFLQPIIDQKNKLIENYKMHAKANWLLIVSGSQGLSSNLSIEDDLIDASYQTKFDRIYLLHLFGSKIYRLKVESR